MTKTVLLDSGPLGVIAHPNPKEAGRRCQEWAARVRQQGATLLVPDVADYEVRRSFLKTNAVRSLGRLDTLRLDFGSAPVTPDVWRKAAELWAVARLAGLPTAPDYALDADVILAALAHVMSATGANVWIATANIGHLARLYEKCDEWQNITPLKATPNQPLPAPETAPAVREAQSPSPRAFGLDSPRKLAN